MRNFYVVRIDEGYEISAAFPSRGPDGARFLGYPQQNENTTPAANVENFPATHCLYGADTQVQAETIAAYLAEKSPGKRWVVMTSNSMFITRPGPVSKSKFTAKGLLPD